jgi:hypothetical protein
MKHVVPLLSIACLLLFVACGQGEKVEKATVSEPEKATEMVKEGVGENNTEMAKMQTEKTEEMMKEMAEETSEMVAKRANEEAEKTSEMKEGETKNTAEEMAPKKME